ncbi:site-specific DNA-methyltransferase [Oceanicaulis sp. UBA2681]|uniref:site-specific DNA-methyltransferase n=1 Tax=Oceanicaulis sp. UBA2681 TaxID=1947007 RepID=UPI00258075FC|nr:DNA methyltransferase [Oceanicaulis sp. UBA2681]|tara:strand:+ start:3064 stop:4404 length:1341 start_codon:yes stop_codon:yes gene_type:complete
MADQHSAHGSPTPNHILLTEVALGDLRLPEQELRKHPARQIANLAKSIERFGFVAPILIDARGEVVAGIARVAAAKKLGRTHAPAVRIEHLSEEEVRAYRIADNKLAEAAEWNIDALRVEIADLIELDFDMETLGFDVAEVDLMFDEGEVGDEPAIPEVPGDPVTRPGDVWLLGQHRLVCGDALKPETYEALLRDEAVDAVDAVFTDAPYNVPVDKHICGLGKVKHREFAMASGEMSKDVFAEFLTTVHARLYERIKQGGIAFSCMDWRSVSPLIVAGESVGFELLNLAVWDKGVGGMGSLYRSQHEMVCVFKKAGASHRNNIELGKHGRNRTNVWAYPGCNSGSRDRDELLKLHPTVKPVALIADALKDVTARGDLVLDVFGGSGSTLLAAEQTGRVGRLIEIDPGYCDVIIERYRKAYGTEATLEATGASFQDVQAQRGGGHEQ